MIEGAALELSPRFVLRARRINQARAAKIDSHLRNVALNPLPRHFHAEHLLLLPLHQQERGDRHGGRGRGLAKGRQNGIAAEHLEHLPG